MVNSNIYLDTELHCVMIKFFSDTESVKQE